MNIGQKIPKDSRYYHELLAKSRIRNPLMQGVTDIVPWLIWDRTTVAKAATPASEITFFNVPIGTSSKTKADTNLGQVKQLDAPEWFNCTHMGFYFNAKGSTTTGEHEADINTFIEAAWHEFWIGQKVYAEGKLFCFPSGYGLETSNLYSTGLGDPIQGTMFDLRLPAGYPIGGGQVADGLTGQIILGGQTFYDSVKGSFSAITDTAGLTIYCILMGVKYRGVA